MVELNELQYDSFIVFVYTVHGFYCYIIYLGKRVIIHYYVFAVFFFVFLLHDLCICLVQVLAFEENI